MRATLSCKRWEREDTCYRGQSFSTTSTVQACVCVCVLVSVSVSELVGCSELISTVFKPASGCLQEACVKYSAISTSDTSNFSKEFRREKTTRKQQQTRPHSSRDFLLRLVRTDMLLPFPTAESVLVECSRCDIKQL